MSRQQIAPDRRTLPGAVAQSEWNGMKRHVRLPSGVGLAYVDFGNPEGKPVLLLHGLTDSSRAWSLLAPYLGDHRLLIPDQRGHGGSDRPSRGYAIADFMGDALLFLDAMGVERAAVVGHSLGSMVAQALAAAHPDRVERIALVASTALPPVRRGDWLWAEIMGLREPVASNEAFLREWSPAASPTPVDPELARLADEEIAQVPLHVWQGVIRALDGVPVGGAAAAVRAPVLILSAGQDALFPAEHHRALVAAYPGARALVLPELGHNLVYERPEEVGPPLAAFLGGG